MKVQSVAIDSIHVDPSNVRTHPERNLATIKASLARFGQQKPIVVDANGICRAGNGTLEAARALGWDKIDVVRTALQGIDATAYAIADNRTAELAEWDDEALAATLKQLELEEFDLESIGFNEDELAALWPDDNGGNAAEDPGAQIDRAAELQAKWGTERGQLWEIPSKTTDGGVHRLLCGDSTNVDDVGAVMDGERAVLLATDPPYGVAYDSVWRAEYSSGEYSVGSIANDDRADWRVVWPLWDVPVLYVWHGGLHAGDVAEGLTACSYDLRAQIIWNKSVMVFGRGAYHWKHEPCWYAVKKGCDANWQGDRTQTTVWDCGNGSGAGRTGDEADNFHAAHISQKPVELFRRPILNHTTAGDVIAEPFAGSGSQYVAAEQLGRRCFGLEIEPKYCAVILERMAGMGLEPKLTAKSG